jgi:hypothetical protein
MKYGILNVIFNSIEEKATQSQNLKFRIPRNKMTFAILLNHINLSFEQTFIQSCC